MAAYRFSAQVIGRSSGRSAVAAAAYRAGIAITDERTGLAHDYTRRGGVVHAEILLPHQAPSWMAERAALWNAVEAAEKRKDAQLAREILLNLPHELDEAQRRELARGFVREEFVQRGMVADLAVHAPHQDGDDRNHHAHVMLTMRGIDGEGFGKKERGWNDTGLLEGWRERWADHQNRALEKAGLAVRVDHRSLEDRGIDREPEPKLGPVATQMERDGRRSHAGDDLRAAWSRNAGREQLQVARDLLDHEIAQERLSQAARERQQAEQRGAFDALFAKEKARLQAQTALYQRQVETLAAGLEGRGHLAVFWDKLRGRLGWHAELELEANRQALTEAKAREEALARAQAQQQVREDLARQHRAAMEALARQREERRRPEPERPEGRSLPAPRHVPPPALKPAFDPPRNPAPGVEAKAREERIKDLFNRRSGRKPERSRDPGRDRDLE